MVVKALVEFSELMKLRHCIQCALLLLICSLPLQGHAQGGYLLADISPSDAAAKVVRQTGGKVLRVTLEERGGKEVYRVKVLLPEGRVKTVFVNKETGGG